MTRNYKIDVDCPACAAKMEAAAKKVACPLYARHARGSRLTAKSSSEAWP